MWFRPIHQRVGPDGALYILDFYNQAVVHNDTRGPKHDPQGNAAIRPDRDHHFGRIWRVQHKEAKKLDLPKLDPGKPAVLVKVLEHPNEWVRMTALRLLLERNKIDVVPQLENLAVSDKASAEARIHALWLLNDLHQLSRMVDQPVLVAAINSKDSAICKNALEMADVPPISLVGPEEKLRAAILNRINDANPRVRLEAIMALGRVGIDQPAIHALMDSYPSLKDPWLESAFVGVAAMNPQKFIAAALDFGNSDIFTNLVTQLAGQIGDKQDVAGAAQLTILIASKPASADRLKEVVLEALTHELKPETVPAWSPELQEAFRSLLGSSNANLANLFSPAGCALGQNRLTCK